MKQMDYFDKRNMESIESLSKSMEKLPDFVFDFFIGIENKTAPLTRKNYGIDLDIFFDYLSKYKYKKPVKEIMLEDMEKLKASDIEAFISYLSYYEYNGKPHKNGEKAKARKFASIRSFFKFLYNKDLISENVASKVETPKLHQKEIIRLETDEVSTLLNIAEAPQQLTKMQQQFNKHTKDRDLAILSLFLGTGIRISELVGLNIKDFDFKQNAFKVTRKGGNQTVLYFSDEVKESLLIWLDRRNEIKLENDEQSMFISLQKRRISTRAVENLVGKYAKVAAPLKKISPHKLRSTFGTNLYRETGDIYIVADVLGHKDVNTTKKHYAAISEDMRKSIKNRIKLR